MNDPNQIFASGFEKCVQLGNQIASENNDADVWDIADGLLAGAVQFWLFSRQPCGDPRCDDCAPMSTAAARAVELRQLLQQFMEESEYYHTPQDSNVGRA